MGSALGQKSLVICRTDQQSKPLAHLGVPHPPVRQLALAAAVVALLAPAAHLHLHCARLAADARCGALAAGLVVADQLVVDAKASELINPLFSVVLDTAGCTQLAHLTMQPLGPVQVLAIPNARVLAGEA